jgi:hypothetical protein
VQQLEEHINEYAELHNSGFTYDKFVSAMELEVSRLKMRKLARCHDETMKKWMRIYTEAGK